MIPCKWHSPTPDPDCWACQTSEPAPWADIAQLLTLLAKICKHWEAGVSEVTEEQSSWHGKMREYLNEVQRIANRGA